MSEVSNRGHSGGTGWDDARDPYGRPLFFAPGSHPAIQRHCEHVAYLRQFPPSTYRDALLAHSQDAIAMFEEGESEAKLRYLMVNER